jgi:quinol monooxygenase YgiN
LQVYAVPSHADAVEAVYKETTKLAQAEEGVVYYCISRDTADPSTFHFFERYKSKEAFQRHNEQEIIVKLVGSGWMRDVKAVFVKPITG